MNKFTTGFILFTLFATAPVTTLSADDGKTTYNKSCTGCHGTDIFTRPDRRVKNMPDLKSRVTQCSYAVEAKWFDKDINAVTSYLNKDFYQF
jgi:cytochrome c5